MPKAYIWHLWTSSRLQALREANLRMPSANVEPALKSVFTGGVGPKMEVYTSMHIDQCTYLYTYIYNQYTHVYMCQQYDRIWSCGWKGQDWWRSIKFSLCPKVAQPFLFLGAGKRGWREAAGTSKNANRWPSTTLPSETFTKKRLTMTTLFNGKAHDFRLGNFQ